MRCPCGGELEKGFIPDFSAAAVWRAVWIGGEPDTDKGWRELLQVGPGIRVAGRDIRAIEAHRCKACGRLELFANAAPGPKETPAPRT